MARRSTAWKSLEKRAAAVLGGVRDPRPWFSFEVRPDCIVEDFDIRVDCKRRAAHAHHRTFRECAGKYCGDGEHMLIVTAEHGDRQPLAVIELSFLAELLNIIRRHEAAENTKTGAHAMEIPEKFESLEQMRSWAIAHLDLSVETIDRMIAAGMSIRIDVSPCTGREIPRDDV